MTALSRYHRLEASGLWRDGPDGQRREVVVALGEATLVIATSAGTALAHWSLSAIVRLNPGQMPAIYAPGAEAGERLELADRDMLAAIDTVRHAIDRRRPHPGRLRLALLAVFSLLALGLAVFWLPGALTRQAVAMLPEASRAQIGRALLDEITQLAGPACTTPIGAPARDRLAAEVFPDAPPRLVILRDTVPATLALPGGILVADAGLVEHHETPEVLAGYLLAEDVRQARADPMLALMRDAGILATLRLMTQGSLAEDVLHAHAATLLGRPRPMVADDALLPRFAAAGLASTPYAYARDISGESVIGLIEADPMRGRTPRRLISDADWVALQDICMR